MQAINTKYFGPTNVRDSRIIAKCVAGKIIVPYDHGFDGDTNHKIAAQKLADKLGWNTPWYGKLVSGDGPDGSTYHVFTMQESV